MKQKNKLDGKIDFSIFEKEDRNQKDKLKKAQKFIEKSEKCKHHQLKSINENIYQKIYWCKKTNNRCNLCTCPLIKRK